MSRKEKQIEEKNINDQTSIVSQMNEDNNNNDTIGSLFDSVESEDPQSKLVSELVSEENLDRKTDLAKPLRWSALAIIKQKFEKCQMKFCNALLEEFFDKSFKYLISKERKGRAEYVQALQSLGNSTNTNTATDSKIKDMMK